MGSIFSSSPSPTYERVDGGSGQADDVELAAPRGKGAARSSPSVARSASPRDAAGFWSSLTWSWLDPLLRLGAEKPLELEDLPALPHKDSVELNSELVAQRVELDQRRSTVTPKDLTLALWDCYGHAFMLAALPLVCWVLSSLMSAYLVSLVVDLADKEAGSSERVELGLWVAAGVVLKNLVSMLADIYYWDIVGRTSARINSGVSALVFRKALRLGGVARGNASNLMNVDPGRISNLINHLHALWAIPLRVLLVVAFLWRMLGPAALVPPVLGLLASPLNMWILNGLHNSSDLIMKMKDKRIKLLQEVIACVFMIKCFAWQSRFAARINEARNSEVKQVRRFAYGIAWLMSMVMSFGALVSLATFSAYILLGNTLSAQYIFPSLMLFDSLTWPLIQLPQLSSRFQEARISIVRVAKFLSLEEVRPPSKGDDGDSNSCSNSDSNSGSDSDSDPIVDMSGTWRVMEVAPEEDDDAIAAQTSSGSAGSGDAGSSGSHHFADGDDEGDRHEDELDGELFHLPDLQLQIKRGSLVVIVGRVASGKTSLLKSMLGEMHLVSGRGAVVRGSVSYCGQRPFLRNATLRDNVLFGAEMDAKRYAKAIGVCALDADIAQFSAGDLTEVGSAGVTLSGGQQARLAMARAVYNCGDIVLFDDVLSACDQEVGSFIFKNCMGKALRNKTRIVVTHQLQYLPFADRVLIMKDGRTSRDGTFEELMGQNIDFASILEDPAVPGHSDSLENASRLNSAPFGSSGGGESLGLPRTDLVREMSTGSTISNCDEDSDVDEHDDEGFFHGAGADKDFGLGFGGSSMKKRASNAVTDDDAAAATDDDDDERHLLLQSNSDSNAGFGDETSRVIDDEERVTGSVKSKVYMAYAKRIGSWRFLAVFVALCVALEALTNLRKLWLSHWSESARSDEQTSSATTMRNLGVFAGLSLGGCLAVTLRMFQWTAGTLTAAQSFHDDALSSVLGGHLRFFYSTPPGRIVNRFSKDLNILDKRLPDQLSDTGLALFSLIFVCITMAYLLPWLLLVMALVSVAYVRVFSYYRKTSRELVRLESINSSPVFSMFEEALSGLALIRCFGRQRDFVREFEAKFSRRTRPYLTQKFISRWLYMRLETIGCVVAGGAVVAVALTSVSSPSAGLLLVLCATLSEALGWLVDTATKTESNMAAVERMLHYTSEVEQEAKHHQPSDARLTAMDWPTRGQVEFRDVKLRYRPNLPLALRGLSLTVHAGESVGVCGRTGSGKSTTLKALLRLMDLESGSIRIDGVDISGIGLHVLRSSMTVIPQDPALFSGTLREQLDPFEEHSDEEVWKALERAQMAEYARGPAMPQGLSTDVMENGSNLSAGQRQLLCLARALLRPRRIVLLDEATANVCTHTDRLVQQIIQTEFTGRTVMTVAHRLDTILHCDRVLVLDNGRLVEAGAPQDLMTDPESHFGRMWAAHEKHS